MTIKNAIDRINWRFGKGGWYNNESDLDAVNTLIRAVSNKKNAQIDNNELIIKLYIFAFGNELKKYNTSIGDPIFQKEFHKKFNRPLEIIIKEFQLYLNDVDQKNLLKKYGFSDTDYFSTSIDEDNNDLMVIDRILKNEFDKKILLGNNSFEAIKTHLLTQATQFMDDYVQ
ncbi:MAG: hypothetical protein ACSHXF_04190 [Aquaticitalea sp.]